MRAHAAAALATGTEASARAQGLAQTDAAMILPAGAQKVQARPYLRHYYACPYRHHPSFPSVPLLRQVRRGLCDRRWCCDAPQWLL